MRSAVRLVASAMAFISFASVASGYYHYIRFQSRNAPYRPIYEKFDLNVLPNRTLTYFISDPNGLQLSLTDSFPAFVSQIRAAAKVWNDVETSDLRLAFGGIAPAGAPQGAPSLEILFDEVTPGLVAMSGPTIRAESNGAFVPILKSVVVLPPDRRTRPSYTEDVFSVLVHEIGHTLGLQHTLTSSAMSTATTRATSKAKPLTADDIAAISILYPRGTLLTTTGSITGRVTMSGAGVNLASVVAIAQNGAAVSSMTNPDGTYRIDGLPPRSYYVYVHPLPPPLLGQATQADINYPLDPDGRELRPSPPFETVFFPGVKDATTAFPVQVAVGATIENVNFAVRSRTSYGIHSVETFGAPANTWVKPPYLSPSIVRPFIVATGVNLIAANAPVPGLAVSVLGGQTLSARTYSYSPAAYIQIDFDPRTLIVSSDSPRHVVFSANNDIYVLPSAFYHTDRLPPVILSLTPSSDGATRTVLVAGANLSVDTRIVFDGVQAQVRGIDDSGRLIVVPPPAPAGYRATVVALNSEGQSSLFMQGDAPPAYVYPPEVGTAAPSLVSLTPPVLSAGMEAMIQIDGLNTNFADGMLSIGFGTTDVTVRRVWVISPTRALANVWIGPAAQPGILNLTLVSGLQMIQQPFSFQVQGIQPRSFWLTSLTMNPVTGQSSLTAGNPVLMAVGAAPAAISPANSTVLLDTVRVPVTAVAGNMITFQIPAGTAPGPVPVRLEINGERSQAIVINVDPPPPRILSATPEAGIARAGSLLSLAVENIGNDSVNKVTVSVGGKRGEVVGVLGEGGHYTVVVRLGEDSPVGDSVPVTVSADTLTSDPITVPISK